MGACASGNRAAKVRAHRTAWAAMAFAAILCCVSFSAGSSVVAGGQAAVAQWATRVAAAGVLDDTVMIGERQGFAAGARDMALAALAEGMREDLEIKEILRGVLPAIDLPQIARDAEVGDDPVQPQVAAALNSKPPLPERSDVMPDPSRTDSGVELDEDGEISLRQVLHAIASPAQKARAGNLRSNDDDDDGTDIDLTSWLLQSQFLGDAMEHIIEIDSFDNSFSIFGVGRFEFQAGGDGEGFAITDLNSGLSLDLGTDSPPEEGLRHRQPVAGRVNLVALVLSFLDTQTGVMTSIFAGTLLLLWGTIRVTGRLRR